MTTFEKVVSSVVEVMNCDYSEVLVESTFADLLIDSLDMIEILMMVELDFGISINDEDAEKCKTVGEFVELVEYKTIDFKK